MSNDNSASAAGFVTYEAFGAAGDGVTDDLPAIVAAHDYANSHGLPVRSRPDATYHLGRRALTAVIATDTDWSTSRFTIDDAPHNDSIEDHKRPLFAVRSLLPPETLAIERLTRDQAHADVRHADVAAADGGHAYHVLVENDTVRRYIRRGLNQNAGTPQHDVFILRPDGSIEGDIDWDYVPGVPGAHTITRIEARPIDPSPLTLRGGFFTTLANRMVQPVGYNYWARNIEITRSNTTVEGLTHYVAGETAVGHPYSGFLSIHDCADITLRDCFLTPHKIYSTIGSAGLPVMMGSYDIQANNVVNFAMVRCAMHAICDRTRWGLIGTNFCKNILLEDCTLSRMDTHQGVSGSYTIRRCRLGHMGLNAIGRGTLTVEDSTLYGRHLVNFRDDYGSTWEGDLVIRGCTWIPSCGDPTWSGVIGVHNDGTHDFGYPCSMPRRVTIDGLHVDDSAAPEGYTGLILFSDPDDLPGGVRLSDGPVAPDAARPYPYARTETLTIRGLVTTSGKPPRISPNAALAAAIDVVDGA